MAAVTAAAVGAATTLYAANRQSRDARDARNAQQGAMDQQVALGREQLDFAREQYQDWQNRFNPILDDLGMMAYEQRDPDYGAITADVGAAFDTSQGVNRRQMQRFGLSPSDGAVQNSEVQYGLGRAQAIVDGRNRARLANQDQRWNRLASFYSLGNGQGMQASNMVQAAYAGLGGSFGQQAGMFGNMANNYSAGASQAWGDMAGWAGWGIGQWMNRGQSGYTHQQPHPSTMGPFQGGA